MSEPELKSSLELAMERLKKKDAEEGAGASPLTEEQRAAIAEVRSFHRAKLAEREILQQSSLARTFDPEERDKLEEQFRRERQELDRECEAKVERIRIGRSSPSS